MSLDPRRRGGSRLAAQEITEQGGFSRGAQGALPPEDSIMVARPGTERPLTEPPAHREQRAHEIRRHANTPEFNEALNKGSYLGGWAGAVEISDRWPGSGEGRAEAMQVAALGRQQAVYDVAAGRDVYARDYLPEAVSASQQLGYHLGRHASMGVLPPEAHPRDTDPSIEADWNTDRDEL